MRNDPFMQAILEGKAHVLVVSALKRLEASWVSPELFMEVKLHVTVCIHDVPEHQSSSWTAAELLPVSVARLAEDTAGSARDKLTGMARLGQRVDEGVEGGVDVSEPDREHVKLVMDAALAQSHDHEGDKVRDPARHEDADDEAQLPRRLALLADAHARASKVLPLSVMVSDGDEDLGVEEEHQERRDVEVQDGDSGFLSTCTNTLQPRIGMIQLMESSQALQINSVALPRILQRVAHGAVPIQAEDEQAEDRRRARHIVHHQPELADDVAQLPLVLQEINQVQRHHCGANDEIRYRQTHNVEVSNRVQRSLLPHGEKHQKIHDDREERQRRQEYPQHRVVHAVLQRCRDVHRRGGVTLQSVVEVVVRGGLHCSHLHAEEQRVT
ncbi:hypothetical protein DNTS_023047 [Danionella cerebrum]|uniref:Uncharacterized protein n=1 Tax=Danionella cerebrum TaxID=2873325 RepID=A0A553Q5C1_9TELE|nr:hypothetical protein DNTS_023047 [Danionella translucida]